MKRLGSWNRLERRASACPRTSQQDERVVNFDGNERLIGHFVDVKITAALPNSLQGEFVALSDIDAERLSA